MGQIPNIKIYQIWCYPSSKEPEKIRPNFEKGAKYPKNIKWSWWKSHHHIQHAREPCRRFLAPICKYPEFFIFCHKKDHSCVYFTLFSFVFPRSGRIEPVIVEDRSKECEIWFLTIYYKINASTTAKRCITLYCFHRLITIVILIFRQVKRNKPLMSLWIKLLLCR